ncbi:MULTISPECIES: hypothetical protein [Comamonas]|uniref:hypothetical protein n=1 Tax=Comamonas TaxID=283 RepID=UPI001E4651C5|nr:MULTISPECIES: hypothetical protein [Comamonas]UUC96573.1 hypothetical protein NOX35_27065 [Comamonas sp. C11]
MQQQYLREAAALLGWSQKALADHMGVPWSTFEKWLAPSESKSFREMPGMAEHFVRLIVENHRLREQIKRLKHPPMGGRLPNSNKTTEKAMSNGQANLSTSDHKNMDAFLGYVLDDYKAGEITKEEAVGALAHVMAALDIGNTAEAVNWFKQGRKFIRSTR